MKRIIITILTASVILLTSCADIAMIRTAQSVASLAIPALRPRPSFPPSPPSPEFQQAKARCLAKVGGDQ